MRIDTGVVTMFICDTMIAQENESDLREKRTGRKAVYTCTQKQLPDAM